MAQAEKTSGRRGMGVECVEEESFEKGEIAGSTGK